MKLHAPVKRGSRKDTLILTSDLLNFVSLSLSSFLVYPMLSNLAAPVGTLRELVELAERQPGLERRFGLAVSRGVGLDPISGLMRPRVLSFLLKFLGASDKRVLDLFLAPDWVSQLNEVDFDQPPALSHTRIDGMRVYPFYGYFAQVPLTLLNDFASQLPLNHKVIILTPFWPQKPWYGELCALSSISILLPPDAFDRPMRSRWILWLVEEAVKFTRFEGRYLASEKELLLLRNTPYPHSGYVGTHWSKPRRYLLESVASLRLTEKHAKQEGDSQRISTAQANAQASSSEATASSSAEPESSKSTCHSG